MAGALVEITQEIMEYVEAFYFNRNIGPDGTVSDNAGTASRTVRVETVAYRGDRDEVIAVIADEQLYNGAKTTVRKIDGPWFEGTATRTTYGEWEVHMDSEEPEEEEELS